MTEETEVFAYLCTDFELKRQGSYVFFYKTPPFCDGCLCGKRHGPCGQKSNLSVILRLENLVGRR